MKINVHALHYGNQSIVIRFGAVKLDHRKVKNHDETHDLLVAIQIPSCIEKERFMKTQLFLFSLLSLLSSLSAQTYFVKYDIATDAIEYWKVKRPGDTVRASHIDLSRGRNVQLRLVNLSNSYRRTVRLVNEPRPQESLVLPFFGSLGGGGEFWKGMKQYDTASASPNQLFNLLLGATKGNTKSTGFEDEAQEKFLKAKLALQKVGLHYASFSKSYESWQSAILFDQNCQLLWKELTGLRYSLQLPATEIKKQVVSKTRAVVPDVADNPAAFVMQQRVDISALAASIEEQYGLLTQAYQEYRSYSMPLTAADTLVKQAAKQALQVKQVPAPAENINLMPRIAELYRQIISDRYVQQVPLTLSSGTTSVELVLTPQADSVTARMLGLEPADTPVVRLIPLYKKEALRFRNTFGVSFTRFAEYRWRYFVNAAGKIDRESSDEYVPVFVTYMHFYAPKDRGFRWGGSFGAGLPMSGEDRQVHLMLGLSTFFGKNDPVCISAGVCGAQVRKLTGYNLGDVVPFAELQDNNYRMVNRLGYFVSLTFNPSALLSNN